jgi:hypothetical protein
MGRRRGSRRLADLDLSQEVGPRAPVHQTFDADRRARRKIRELSYEVGWTGDEEVRREGGEGVEHVLAEKRMIASHRPRIRDREPAPLLFAEEAERRRGEPDAAGRFLAGLDDAVETEQKRWGDVR